MKPALTIDERFDRYTCYTGDCIVWIGCSDQHGYGSFYESRHRPYLKAHRFAYEREHGLFPIGLDVDHLCRNPSCVNPAHLEAVPHRVNVQRGLAAESCRKRGAAITHCKSGHELSGENVYHRNGRRHCRQCRRSFNEIRHMKLMKESVAAGNLCECGCGERTTLVLFNRYEYGEIKGVSRRFIRGHANRGKRFK